MARNPDAPLRGMEAVVHAIMEPELDSVMSDFAEADCFAVVTFDPTTGYRAHIGPFEDLDEAFAYATRVQDDLNTHMPSEDVPFQATVVPMKHPEQPGG